MASTYIYRTPSSTGSNTISTFSAWLKKQVNGSYEGIFTSVYETGEYFQINFEPGNALEVRCKVSSSYVLRKITSRKFRDNSAFYHIVVTIDTTDSTAEDRVKIYVNGTRETSFSTNTNPSSSQNLTLNTAGSYQHRLGRDEWSTPAYFDGIMAHVHWVDGTAYQASTFGETDSTSGIWVPKTAPSVTYGTNGFFLKFADSSNLDLDSSGNNLTFATSGTLTQNVDTPTNNYCTLNPLDYNSISLSNGDLEAAWSQSAGTFGFTRGTIGFGSGKYYWEVKISSSDNSAGLGLGVVDITGKEQLSSTTNQGNSIGSFFGVGASFSTTKALYKQSNNTSTSITGSWSNDDIIGIAYDGSTGKIYMWKNGSEFSGQTFASGTSFNDVNLTADTFVVPYFGVGDGGSGTKNVNVKFNFGQGYFGTTAVSTNSGNGYQDANSYGKFNYSVPSGHYAINTKNLKEFG
jgi:hypothetical protein